MGGMASTSMAQSSDKQQELIKAFSYGYKEKALSLLKKTEKPAEIRDSYNWTLLHYAATNGWADVCQQLVELYQVDPHVKDSIDGETALHHACRGDHTDIVKYLVNHTHCDPLIENYDRDTPFKYSHGGSRDFLQDIIDKAKKKGLTVVEYTKSSGTA